MCVLYASFGSKARPRTFGCVAMGSALLCMFRYRLLVNSARSSVNRVQVVLSGFQIQNLFITAQSTQIKSVISVPIKNFIHHYPRALFNDIPRVGAYFYDIPGSGSTFTTYPGRGAV